MIITITIVVIRTFKDQLQEIRKTTFAQILCMTSNIQSAQRRAFNIPSNT